MHSAVLGIAGYRGPSGKPGIPLSCSRFLPVVPLPSNPVVHLPSNPVVPLPSNPPPPPRPAPPLMLIANLQSQQQRQKDQQGLTCTTESSPPATISLPSRRKLPPYALSLNRVNWRLVAEVAPSKTCRRVPADTQKSCGAVLQKSMLVAPPSSCALCCLKGHSGA